MFGMGFSEIVVILVIALIFLGPEKLPDAAKSISKGIRDLRKQTRELQHQIEGDEHIGGAIRDLRSALRGEEPPRPRPASALPPPGIPVPGDQAAPGAASLAGASGDGGALAEASAGVAADPAATPAAAPTPTLPSTAGELADERAGETADGLADLVKPARGTVAKGSAGPEVAKGSTGSDG